MTDIKDLIEKIKRGDTASFCILVDEYKRLVYNIVVRMTPNSADREDLCQDIFIKVYQNLNGFNHDAKLSTWIAKIAFNSCINYLKKRKVPLLDDTLSESETSSLYQNDEPLPDSSIENSDLSIRLQHEVNKLPAQFKAIITFYHLQEMSYSEIGEILNMPEGTVKSYLFRARKLLKQRLLDKYYQEELCQ